MPIEEAKLWRSGLKQKGKKLVMTNGCFDILHRGHITYMMKARELGDALIIAINSDRSVRELKGIGRPVINQNDRAFIIASLLFVDGIIIFDTQKCDGIISEIQPDIYAKGADYNLQTMEQSERAVLEKIGCKIEFISFVDGYSTTSILKKISN
ncbi:MAG TPA: hypothetical protein DD381_02650 [Lentisphaeria bacterium]|nr:MAG: hypothetical protein A2X47_03605 [Lentisphaerae bacterium GWF2_38_69]HBM15234.1 hypothetical protein [Lentisphaeria bacterium]